jgi:archaellum component FlaC
MAEVETLTYEFQSRNLDSLKREMEELSEKTESIGSEAEETATEMESSTASMEDSIEDVEDQVEELRRALESITTRDARRSLSRLEDAVDGVDFGGLAASAAGAFSAIKEGAEEAEDDLLGAGLAGIEAGEAIQSGAEEGEDAYEDLTAQVLAAKAAIESVDGVGPETNVNLQSGSGGSGGGGGIGLGTVLLGAGLKESLENTIGTGAKISEFGDAASELVDSAGRLADSGETLQDAAIQLKLAASQLASADDEEIKMPIWVEKGAEKEGNVSGAGGEVDLGDEEKSRSSSRLLSYLGSAGSALRSWTASLSRSKLAVGGVTAALATVTAALGAYDAAVVAAQTALTGLATKLAMEYGDQELQTDLQAIGAQFKETASLFVDAFEPIIRGTVIPLLEDLSMWLRSNIDELKDFAQRGVPRLRDFVSTATILAEKFGKLISTVGQIGAVEALFDALLKLAWGFDMWAKTIQSVFGSSQPDTSQPSKAGEYLQPRTEGGSTVLAPTEPSPQSQPEEDEDPSRAALGAQEMGPLLNDMAGQIGRIRERFQRGLIAKDEMLRQIVSARESAFQELQKLGQKMPGIVTDNLMSHLASELRKLKGRLSEMQLIEAPPNAQKVQGAPPTNRFPRRKIQEGPLPEGMDLGLGALKGAKEGADSVSEINSLIQATRDQFDTLNNEEARDFIGRLQRMRSKMNEAKNAAKAVGQAMQQSIARSADRVFQALGQGFSDAIFGQGKGKGKAQAKLNLFNARDQVKEMQRALKSGQISHKKFALSIGAQKKKIQERQEELNETMEGGFAKAADTMVSAFKKAGKQLIAEITAVIAKMAVLKAITSAFSISSGGFLGSVISNLGGGAFLDGAAEGGTVKQSGLAVIHQGEEIVPSDTVSTLESLVQPATPQVAPAGAGGMDIKVEVQGETTTSGEDLKTTYDTATRIQRRKGRA